jgi:hypothetical protein
MKSNTDDTKPISNQFMTEDNNQEISASYKFQYSK